MKVNSSIISDVQYEGWLMVVTFKNWWVYRYEWVQPEDYRKMIQAPSIGWYFKQNFGKYKYKKVK